MSPRTSLEDGSVFDKRVTFVFQDPVHGMWPVLVRMNLAAAWSLLMKLEAACE